MAAANSLSDVYAMGGKFEGGIPHLYGVKPDTDNLNLLKLCRCAEAIFEMKEKKEKIMNILVTGANGGY
jgi:hypothetical protein